MRRPIAVLILAVPAIMVALVLFMLLVGPTHDNGARLEESDAQVGTDRPSHVTAGTDETETAARRELVTRAEKRAPAPEVHEKVPQAREPPVAGRIRVQGTVTVVDAQGIEHPSESGSFGPLFWKGSRADFGSSVRVDAASFELVMDPSCRLGIEQMELGGRRALLERTDPIQVRAGEPIALRAYWQAATILRVVDAESGADLRGITLVRCTEEHRENDIHPGQYGPEDIIAQNATSPVTLTRPADRFANGIWIRRVSQVVWVHVDGYAWGRITIDYDFGGERTIALKPAAELEVTLVNYRRPAGTPEEGLSLEEDAFPQPMLRLRERPEPWPEESVAVERALAELRATPEDAYPDGIRPTEEEIRAWVHEFYVERDERGPDREAVSGPLLLERVPEAQGPTVLAPVPAGAFVVSVEIGEAYAAGREVLAWANVTLEAGHQTRVTLQLKDPPRQEPRIPVGGTLYLPTSWGRPRIAITLQATDLPDKDPIEISLSEMEPVPGRAGLYRWSAGELVPGQYEISIREFECSEIVQVDENTREDIHIELPEPAEVILRILDEDTRAPLDVEPIWVANSEWSRAPRDPATGAYCLWAPAGRVTFHISDEAYHSHVQQYDLLPGRNEITVTLRKACGVVIRAREGERPIPMDVIGYPEVSEIDGRGGWTGGTSGDREVRMRVSNPGLYEIRVQPIEGYEPVPPAQIRIPPGEFVEHVVVLKRKL
ncbi:MAG: hypothetical protein AB1486_08120 [Planctomycetota bacterium]